jgi:hypothetical protein
MKDVALFVFVVALVAGLSCPAQVAALVEAGVGSTSASPVKVVK